jgi:hypothetical protein
MQLNDLFSWHSSVFIHIYRTTRTAHNAGRRACLIGDRGYRYAWRWHAVATEAQLSIVFNTSHYISLTSSNSQVAYPSNSQVDKVRCQTIRAAIGLPISHLSGIRMDQSHSFSNLLLASHASLYIINRTS